MKTYPNVRLDGKHTDLSFWAGLLLFPLVFPLLFFIVLGNGITLKAIIFAVLFGLLFLLACWLLFNLTKGHIKDNQLYLKKFFRPTKVYDLGELTSVKSFSTTNAKHIQISNEGLKARKDTYTYFEMNKNGNTEKYLIVGYNFFLGNDESTDTEQLLKEILAENKKHQVQV